METILVFNCGSSSIKFALFDLAKETCLIKGIVERVNTPDTTLSYQIHEKISLQLGQCDYIEAIKKIFSILQENHADNIIAVGHRVVHGGEDFSASVLINHQVITAIEQSCPLAPLHNPANLAGIKAVSAIFPQLPQVAVFDTAFHQSLAKTAYLYPIPYDYYEKYRIRKYGFHGISHRYVVEKAASICNKPLAHCQFISAHLGNGASVTASKGGKSIDTSMGFTPLAGLMMGTRCGDIDPGIHAYLCENEQKTIDEITQIFNQQSGLLGISDLSMDMRSLNAAKEQGDKRAKLAIDMFCFQLSKTIGALATHLTHIDALIFTGGIGENDHEVRAQVINQLSLLGFVLEPTLNQYAGKIEHGRITTAHSTLALVIPTNEELLIAQDTLKLVREKS